MLHYEHITYNLTLTRLATIKRKHNVTTNQHSLTIYNKYKQPESLENRITQMQGPDGSSISLS